jgi:hypothetical protein
MPYTLGNAGILFNHKQHDAIGEAIHYFHRVLEDRNTLLNGQTRRLEAFDLNHERARLMAVLDKVSQ